MGCSVVDLLRFYHLQLIVCKYFSKWEFSCDARKTTACFSQYSMFFIRVRTVVIPPYFWFCFFVFRLSTKPGCVPSTLKSHSLTAERQFLASNTVWRFRRGVRLYCLTMMKSSTEDSPVSSVQVQCTAGRVLSPSLSRWFNYVVFVCFLPLMRLVVFHAFLHRSPESTWFGNATLPGVDLWPPSLTL